jgi:hypothetical protein
MPGWPSTGVNSLGANADQSWHPGAEAAGGDDHLGDVAAGHGFTTRARRAQAATVGWCILA